MSIKSKKKKRIIVFAYSFPPLKSIGTIRNLNIVTQLAQHFDEVVVFTTSNYKVTGVENYSFPENIKRFIVPTIDYKTIGTYYKKWFKKKKVGNEKPATDLKDATSKFNKLMNTFPINIIFGLGGIVYSLLSVLGALRHLKGATHVYSSLRPYVDHFSSFLLKLFKPSLFWVADFRDVPINPDRENAYFIKFQHRINRFLFKKADLLTTVSRGLEQNLKSYNKNTLVIRNSISELSNLRSAESMKDVENVKNILSGKFNIAYTGTIYSGGRDPDLLCKATAHLRETNSELCQDLQLVYAGKNEKLWQYYIATNKVEDYAQSFGFVSMEEATTIQKNSQINLLLSWCTPNLSGVLTGKFYEYIAAQRPIVLIIKGVHDPEFEEIFKKLDLSEIYYSDKTDEHVNLAKFIEKLYSMWKESNDSIKLNNDSTLEEFRWSKTFLPLKKAMNI